MKAADSSAISPVVAPSSPARPVATTAAPATNLRRRANLAAALLGILIALFVATACAAVGLLLASAIFGTTGGIL